jgi:hypothetical protein
VKITVKLGVRILPLLLILFLESGCTYAIWTNGDLDAYKEPAPTPNVRLYESQKKNDILVVYNEYSERNDSTHTRAYWLNKNENRVRDNHIPAFARKNSVDHLPLVPVFYSLPEIPESNRNLYAVCNTNFDTLVLYSGNREINSFNLPVYKDRQGTVEKIALTPVAVTTDATVVSAEAALFIAYAWAQSGYSFRVGK